MADGLALRTPHSAFRTPHSEESSPPQPPQLIIHRLVGRQDLGGRDGGHAPPADLRPGPGVRNLRPPPPSVRSRLSTPSLPSDVGSASGCARSSVAPIACSSSRRFGLNTVAPR